MTTNTVCLVSTVETPAPTTKATTKSTSTTSSTTTESTTKSTTTTQSTTKKMKPKKCPIKASRSALTKSIQIEVNEMMNLNLNDLISEKFENAKLDQIEVSVSPSKYRSQLKEKIAS